MGQLPSPPVILDFLENTEINLVLSVVNNVS